MAEAVWFSKDSISFESTVLIVSKFTIIALGIVVETGPLGEAEQLFGIRIIDGMLVNLVAVSDAG